MEDQEARQLLQAERALVQKNLDEARAAAKDDIAAANEDGDIADPAAPLVAEETDDAIAAFLSTRLEAIERAEQRLAAGTFGRSIQSGRVIPDDRLRADPAAELTVDEANAAS